MQPLLRYSIFCVYGLVICLTVSGSFAHADELDESTRPSPFRLENAPQKPIVKPVLLSVHHEQFYDGCGVTGKALDKLVDEYKRRNDPVIFLASSNDPDPPRLRKPGFFADKAGKQHSWIGHSRDADHVLKSNAGEHDLKIAANDVTVTGGFFGACHLNAIQQTMRGHFGVSKQKLTINLPMDAIYMMSDPQSSTIRGNVQCARSMADYYKTHGTQDFLHVLGGTSARMKDRLFMAPVSEVGKLNPSDYTLVYSLDGKPFGPKIGTGPNVVEFKFWSADQHPFLNESGSGDTRASSPLVR